MHSQSAYELNQVKSQFKRQAGKHGMQPGLSTEGLRTLVYLENKNREAQGNDKFNCHVIDIKELDTALSQIKKLNIPPGKSERIQLIINNDGHFSAVDIKLSDRGNEFILLDAAGDPRWRAIHHQLQQDNFFTKGYFPNSLQGNIQKRLF